MRIAFNERSPEQLYDATYHVRIIPKHIWDTVPRPRWQEDTVIGHLVGSGAYHVQDWQRGKSLTLVADSTRAASNRTPKIRRVIWRFAPDADAALNRVDEFDEEAFEDHPAEITSPAGLYAGLQYLQSELATFIPDDH